MRFVMSNGIVPSDWLPANLMLGTFCCNHYRRTLANSTYLPVRLQDVGLAGIKHVAGFDCSLSVRESLPFSSDLPD